MSAGAHLPLGWSQATVARESTEWPAVTAAESFPQELGFRLTFLAGYSYQWSGGRLGKTAVKVSMLSCGLSGAVWEPAEGGTFVIWNPSVAKIEIFCFSWKIILCQKMKVISVSHNIQVFTGSMK